MKKFNENYKIAKNVINIADIKMISCIYNAKEYGKIKDVKTGRVYINEILDLIENALYYGINTSYYAKSYKVYKETKEQNPPCYLFADDECICFKGNDILNYFNHLKDFKCVVNKKAILAQLKYYDLLKCQSGEYSFPCQSTNNKTHYYHMYIEQIAYLLYPHENDIMFREDFINRLQE